MIQINKLRNVFLFILLLNSIFSQSQTPKLDKNWDTKELRLDENFDGTALNTKLWQNGLGYPDTNGDERCLFSIYLQQPIFHPELQVWLIKVETWDANGHANHQLRQGDKVAFKGILGISTKPDINQFVFTILSAEEQNFIISVNSLSGTYIHGTGCIIQDYHFDHNIRDISVSRIGDEFTVITPFPHELNVGDKVVFSEIQGYIPEINSTLFTINSITSNTLTFTAPGISGNYTPYTGILIKTDNVYLDGNSNLILQSDYDPHRSRNQTIHSGAIASTKQDYYYGYYEIRCKLNSNGKRYMPAFWLYGAYLDDCNNVEYWNNENDFFEAYLDPTSYNISSNVHNYKGSCLNRWGKMHSFFSENTDFFNNFHTFGYEWTPNRIIYYLDNLPYHCLNSQYVANHPLTLLTDLGIKIPWSFAPTDLGTNPPDFKNFMTIDYIKVYNLKLNCIDETITNFNSYTYNNYSVKNKILISGTCVVKPGEPVTLRANEFLVNSPFTIPIESEMILLPTQCFTYPNSPNN